MRKRNGLKITFLNIVSLRKYRIELEVLLHDNDIDIIGLSETRLGKTISDTSVSIEGYRMYHNDRDINGGGVAIYIKDSVPEPVLKITSKKLEFLSLEIQPSHYCKPFNVVCWHRPPTNSIDNDAFEELREVLLKLDSDKKETSLELMVSSMSVRIGRPMEEA